MKNDKFKKKFTREVEPEEDEKKDPRGPRCFKCSTFGTWGLIVGISSRPRGRLTTLLSANLKKRRPQIRIRSFWPS